jgi:hypothetical protein
MESASDFVSIAIVVLVALVLVVPVARFLRRHDRRPPDARRDD